MTDPADGVPLTIDAVRVLASRPRFEILRKLQERRMTGAEISETLGMTRGKAHAHLAELARAGFVRREGDDRVWVYYSLTPTGERLSRSQRPRIVILLSGAIASTLAAAGLLVARMSRIAGSGAGAGSDPTLPPNRPPDLDAPAFEWMIPAVVFLAVIAVYLATIALMTFRRDRARSSDGKTSGG